MSYGYRRFKDFLDGQSDIVETRLNPKGSHLEIRILQNDAAAGEVNIAEAMVDRYLAILRASSINITPNEDRPRIIRESFPFLRELGWNSFMQTRDKMWRFFDEKYPGTALGQVLDAVYQIAHSSCLEWELSNGNYPPETSLWQRQARLKEEIRNADELLARIDQFLVGLIRNGVQPL